VTLGLLGRRYDQDHSRDFGENFLRVFEETWDGRD
jgi:hypothetical protein